MILWFHLLPTQTFMEISCGFIPATTFTHRIQQPLAGRASPQPQSAGLGTRTHTYMCCQPGTEWTAWGARRAHQQAPGRRHPAGQGSRSWRRCWRHQYLGRFTSTLEDTEGQDGGEDAGQTALAPSHHELGPNDHSFAPQNRVGPNSSPGQPAGWGRSAWSRRSPSTALGSAQQPPIAQGTSAPWC